MPKTMQDTKPRTAETRIRRPQRWDTPFDPAMSRAEVERIFAIPPFSEIDPADFPPSLPLAEIIRNDARVLNLRPGEIVVREGDYGSSLFVVLSGSAQLLEKGRLPHASTGGGEAGRPDRKTLLGALAQLWRNSRIPEQRDPDSYAGADVLVLGGQRYGRQMSVLPEFRSLIADKKTVPLRPHAMFGETAALSRTPHTATVFADNLCQVLELRWQGLRDLRRWNAGFRRQLDELYRSRRLEAHLREVAILRHMDEKTLAKLARSTLLESYGEHEWSSAFKRTRSKGDEQMVRSEPVIAEAGDYVDGLIVIRSGFGRVTERVNQGFRTVGFATRNELFGLDEIIDHWRGGAALKYRNGLRAVGYVDLLRIPTALVEEFILPEIFPGSGAGRKGRLRSILPSRPKPEVQADSHDLDEGTLNFLVDSRTINGTAVMFINTDRCTGCDDCVRACAAAHDGNPRFLRAGQIHQNLMVTKACMHCVDPVCTIGCPTGAIQRSPQDGLIVIDDSSCIGCSICADTCPYDNIRMVEIRDQAGVFVVDEETHEPILKATKCDFCLNQPGGPACQRACPHDALVRLDARQRRTLGEWIE